MSLWGETSLAGFWNSLNYFNGMFSSQISPGLFLCSPSFCSNITLSVRTSMIILLLRVNCPPNPSHLCHPLLLGPPWCRTTGTTFTALTHQPRSLVPSPSEVSYISLACLLSPPRAGTSVWFTTVSPVPRTMLGT